MQDIVPVGDIAEFYFAHPGPDTVWVEILEIDGFDTRVYDPYFNLEFWTKTNKLWALKIKPEQAPKTKALIAKMKVSGKYDQRKISPRKTDG